MNAWAAQVWPLLRREVWVWGSVVLVSLSYAPLVSSLHYAVLGAVLAAVVVLVGGLLRAGPLPWPAIVAIQAAALVEWTTVLFARDHAIAGLLPSAGTFGYLHSLATDTLTHAQNYPAPVPRLDALDATMAMAIGVLTLVVDILVTALRRPALAGVVFLAVYVIPVAVLRGDIGIWAFVPGAIGFVFMLGAAEREHVVSWGRHLADVGARGMSTDGATRGSGLATSGRRLGLAAVAGAVVVPLFIPTAGTALFDPDGGIGAGTGLGDGPGGAFVSGNPILDMRRNLRGQSSQVLLRIRTDDQAPDYLRLTALPDLSAEGWSPGRRPPGTSLKPPLPGAPGVSTAMRATTGRYQVKVTGAFHSSWLPVLYAPTKIDVKGGDWRIDSDNMDVTTRGSNADIAGSTYSFSAKADVPAVPDLRSSVKAPPAYDDLRQVPRDLPRVIRQRAAEVTRGAKTDYDKALALQRWFRSDGGFTYDLRPAGGDGISTIARFVSTDRRGYCEQFASAMAMMARIEGIPARVAIGFLQPEQVDASTYTFRGTDMHAWPELFFDGVGWVRFEPTPGGTNYNAPAFPDDSITQDLPDSQGGDSSTAPLEPRATRRTQEVSAAPASNSSGGGGGNGLLVGLSLAAALVVLALVPMAARTVIARRRWRATEPVARAEAAWLELGDHVRDLGMEWDRTATPQALSKKLALRLRGDDEAVASLQTIADQVERARYAPAVADGTSRGLREEVDRVVRGLREVAPTRRVWLARLLPTAWMRRRSAPGSRGRGELLALRE